MDSKQATHLAVTAIATAVFTSGAALIANTEFVSAILVSLHVPTSVIPIVTGIITTTVAKNMDPKAFTFGNKDNIAQK